MKLNIRMSSSAKQYLLYFAQEHLEFRFPEIESLVSLLNISMNFVEQPTPLQPYWIVEFKSENDVTLLANRSVSLRSCMELWAHSQNVEELHNKLKVLPSNVYDTHLVSNKTFKISVQTFCKRLTQRDKIERIETFSYLPTKGEVSLNNPDTHLQYLEYYGINSNELPEEPYWVFFGRQITLGCRQAIKQISLKTRKFIGNTSMDPQLSLLMANQAKITSGDVVLDPFVGSGSLLVAAAQFGGYVMGTDIDYLMLHGKTRPSRINQKYREQDEGIKANMEQYSLKDKYVDVLVNDFTTSFWRDNLIIDSIVTDPPYGIREAKEKVGINKENYSIKEKHLSTHIPAKVQYEFAQLYQDLLSFATKHLKLGGRLVCWFPVFRDDYTDEGLPTHVCLKLIANSEQVLSKYTARRLLTYEKIAQPTRDTSESCNNVVDFRIKYFQVRDETRHERRTKQAALKEKGRLRALERLKLADK